jgi:hypothetical protein
VGALSFFWFEFLRKARDGVGVLRQVVIGDAGCGQDRTGISRLVYKFCFLSGKQSRSKPASAGVCVAWPTVAWVLGLSRKPGHAATRGRVRPSRLDPGALGLGR